MKKVCPNCGSCEIDYASMRTDSCGVVGLGISERYYCTDCGYKGSVILEVADSAKCPAKKQYHEKNKARNVEIIRPVYTTILILLFITSVMLMVPKYEINKEKVPVKMDVSRSIQEIPDQRTMNLVGMPVTVIQMEPSKLEYVDNAMGMQASLLVQLFFMFFVTGFLVLMAYSHWHRVRIFW